MNYSYEKVDKLLCVSADIDLIAGHVQSGFPEWTWHDIGNLELSVRIHGSLESLAIYMYTLPPCQWNREKFTHSKHNIEMTFSLDVIDTYISYFFVWSSPRKWAFFFYPIQQYETLMTHNFWCSEIGFLANKIVTNKQY